MCIDNRVTELATELASLPQPELRQAILACPDAIRAMEAWKNVSTAGALIRARMTPEEQVALGAAGGILIADPAVARLMKGCEDLMDNLPPALSPGVSVTEAAAASAAMQKAVAGITYNGGGEIDPATVAAYNAAWGG